MRTLLTTVLCFLAALTLHAQKTTLSSSTFGEWETRAIGPAVMGGRITAIEGVIQEPRTLFIGTAGGGIWKTNNGGVTFDPVFDKYPQSIGCLAIDQQRPDTIWAGTGESNMRNTVSVGLGIYKSTDGGRNWRHMGLDNSEHISKIIIHPNDPNTLLVAVPGKLWSDSPDRGLYKTTDGGQNWEKILYTDEKTGCSEVLMDPRNPDVLYAAMWQFRRTPFSFSSGGPGSALYKSTDGGKNWTKLTNGLPEGPFGRIAMALAPSAPDNLLAIVESENTGLYISSDAGQSWKLQSSTFNVTARPFYFSTLVVDPNDPKRVYRPAFSLSISNDGGYSFSDAGGDGGWVHSDHHALWINPNYTDQMYLGTDGGVYASVDRGVTWIHLNSLPVSQYYHVAVDNASPYQVYGGLQDNGSWVGPSMSPGGIENKDWENVGGGDGFWVQIDDTDPMVVFSESQGGMMQRVNRRTNQSLNIQPQALEGDPELRWNWNTPIVKSPAEPGVLFTGAQFLFRSDDQGQSWRKISPDLTTDNKEKQQQYSSGGLTVDNSSAENHCTIFAIAPSPLDKNLIYAGTDDGNIQRSTDGGQNWTLISQNIPGVPKGTWVTCLEASRFDRNTLYATFDNHKFGDMNTYLAKSSNGGQSWELLSSDTKTLKGYAHVIREDRTNPNLLFLGTEFGLYISNNGGQNWVLFKAGLPEYLAIRDIAIHPATNDLVLATHGRGLYILDDLTPLRKLTPELLDKEAGLLPTRPTAVTTGHYGQSFPSGGSYVGPNARESVRIMYYLKNRASSGKVQIDILNEKGEVIAELPGSRRKGLNVLHWEMRTKPPKAAGGVMVMGEPGVFAGAIGPMAAPGQYTVRLTVNDLVDETPLQLIPDPVNPNLNYARRSAISAELFQMVEQLGLLEARVKQLSADCQDRATKTKNKKANQALTSLKDKLDALYPTLTETNTAKGITGEKKLRANIGSLYVLMEVSDELPTVSSIKRQEFLKSSLADAEKQAKAMFDETTAINAMLARENLEPLKILEKSAFMEGAGSIPGKGFWDHLPIFPMMLSL